MSEFNYTTIPDKLRQLSQWGNFNLKWVEERHKNTKIPINSYTGLNGKSNAPSSWADFSTALTALDKYDRADGLALYLENGLVGLDVDHIKDDLESYLLGDPDPDNLIRQIKELTKNSYMEVSQSGEGIHVIFKGKIPGKRRRKGQFEMYQSGRFFAMTGNRIGSGDVKELNHDEMLKLYEFCFGKDPEPVMREAVAKPINNLSIGDVIRKALSSKTGDRFAWFMYGGWEGHYNSHSEADIAFANDLAFWCSGDVSMMRQIFENSAMIRPKFNSKRGNSTYGQELLEKAASEAHNFYSQEVEEADDYHADLSFLDTEPNLPDAPKHYSQDDTGNAKRFVEMFGDDVRYMSGERKGWYIYENGVWSSDDMGKIETMADKVPERMLKEKLPISEDMDKSDISKAERNWNKFISQTRNRRGIQNMLATVQHYVPVKHGSFDKDPMLLNVKNGYIDLHDGSLHPHSKKMMFSLQANAEYHPQSAFPVWEGFLNQIFKNNKDVIHYLQKWIGYTVTGLTIEQQMVMFNGGGRNGKSTLADTIYDLLGSYAKSINVKSLMNQKGSNASNPEIAELEGARFVLTSEPNEGDVLDESQIKQMTGGDPINAKKLYGDPFEMTPKFKLLMQTNHLPTIKGTDDGIWRRIVVFPFNVQIPIEKVDKHLKEKLHKEYSGILNWIVQGTLMYQKEGLDNVPEIMRSAANDYREELDIIQQFLNDTCIKGRTPDYMVKASELYQKYQEWAKNTGSYDGYSMTKFGIKVKEKIQSQHTRNGNFYIGIKINSFNEPYPNSIWNK